MHAAQIVSMLYNINQGKYTKSPADFMPDFLHTRSKEAQHPDESMRSLFRIAAESLPRKGND